MNWYLKAMKQYATFSGRAQRSEYWFFMLFYTIGIFIFAFIDGFVGTAGVLIWIYIIGNIAPVIGVSVRRLHDIGKSGWWYLIVVVPYIGSIVLLVFALYDSQEDNQYGANPKAV